MGKFGNNHDSLSLLEIFLLLKHFAEEKKGLVEGLSVQAIDSEHYDPIHYKTNKAAIFERIDYQIRLCKLVPARNRFERLVKFDVEEIIWFLPRIWEKLRDEKLFRNIFKVVRKKDFESIFDLVERLFNNPTYRETREIPPIYHNLFNKKFPEFLDNEYLSHMAKIIDVSEKILSINRSQKKELIDMKDPSRIPGDAKDVRKISDVCRILIRNSSEEVQLLKDLELWEVMKIDFMNLISMKAETITKREDSLV